MCYSVSMSDQKHPGGRPLKFQSVKELESAIDAYFAECEREEDSRVYKHGEQFPWPNQKGDLEERCKDCRRTILDEYALPTRGCILVSGEFKERTRPTITGLSLALDCDKETIREYRERDEFSAPIKRAYLRVEQEHEFNLHDARVPPVKTIFALSNFGWKNPQHIDQTLTVKGDSAAALAKRVFDDDDEVEETATDETVEDQSSTEAHAEKADLASAETESI
jgi:hypothetical protein